MQIDEEKESVKDEENSQKNNRQREKPPPIYTCDMTTKKLATLLSNNSEINNCYIIKPNSNDCATIYTYVYEKCTILQNFLKENQINFYSFTPKHLKNKKLVLKNLYGEYTIKEIVDEITKKCEQKIEIVKIIKINKIIDYNKTMCYLVIFKNSYETHNLKKINYIFGQSIRWQEFKQKSVYQCHKCQLTGHSSYNCNLEYKCVRCTEKHKPGECPKKLKNNKTPSCVNCGQEGHPASYRGCDYIKFTQQLKKNNDKMTSENRNKKINKIYDKVMPNIPYSQILRNKNNYNYREYPITDTQCNTQTDNNIKTNNYSFEAMLNQMTNNIIQA